MRAAKSLGATRWQTIQKVMIPSALPVLFAGQTTRLMAGIAVLSVLGLLSTWVLRWMERLVVRGVE